MPSRDLDKARDLIVRSKYLRERDVEDVFDYSICREFGERVLDYGNVIRNYLFQDGNTTAWVGVNLPALQLRSGSLDGLGSVVNNLGLPIVYSLVQKPESVSVDTAR